MRTSGFPASGRTNTIFCFNPVEFDRGFAAAERAAAAIVRAIDAGGWKMRCAAGARLAMAERTVMAEVCDHADPSRSTPGWPEVPLVMQAIAVDGRLGFVTAPGEPYVDVGLKIRAGSPFKRTALISCANDFAGGERGDASHTAYFAPRESYTRHRFEPTYTRPDFTFDTTDRYIAAALDLLGGLRP
ncbi:MAG: hypothetical protein ABIF71_01595 [Planctomycetota bacterium]